MWIRFVLFFLLLNLTLADHSIDAYGGVANISTSEVAHNNTLAIIAAFNAANMDSNQTNRVVLLPAGNTYYFFAVSIGNLENLRLKVDGIFKGSDNITEWESTSNGIDANLYIQVRFSKQN